MPRQVGGGGRSLSCMTVAFKTIYSRIPTYKAGKEHVGLRHTRQILLAPSAMPIQCGRMPLHCASMSPQCGRVLLQCGWGGFFWAQRGVTVG